MVKAGTKIECFENTGMQKYLTIGKIYEVLRTENEFVYIISDNGKEECACLSRFRTCKEFAAPLKRILSSLVQESPSDTAEILTLPTDSEARKQIPMFSGCIKYFPAAIAGVAKISKAGNDKHNPGQELHHDRSKSLDHADCIIRHLTDVADLIAKLERGDDKNPEQILAEVSSLAWRALAYSQTLHEKYDGAPLAPGAK